MRTINGIMEVNVVGAKGLKNTDELFGRMDPYVVLEYKGQQYKSSTARTRRLQNSKKKVVSKFGSSCCMCVHGQGRSPVWNEKFKFRVEYHHHSPEHEGNKTNTNGNDVKEQYKLILKIMDHNNFTNDDYLGHAIIYVKEVFERGVVDGIAELRTQKYRVVYEDKTYRGEIQVGVTFTTAKDEQENGGKKERKQMMDVLPQ